MSAGADFQLFVGFCSEGFLMLEQRVWLRSQTESNNVELRKLWSQKVKEQEEAIRKSKAEDHNQGF